MQVVGRKPLGFVINAILGTLKLLLSDRQLLALNCRRAAAIMMHSNVRRVGYDHPGGGGWYQPFWASQARSVARGTGGDGPRLSGSRKG